MARSNHNRALSIATALGRVVLAVILLCPALGPLAVPSVQAQEVITAYYQQFDNTNIGAFQLNGDDSDDGDTWSPEVTGDYRLRLTEPNTNQFGTAWWQQRVTLADDRSFSAYFSFWIGDNSEEASNSHDGGADGIVFAIQTQSSGEGSHGEGLGYAGITDSVGIEFDTHQNKARGFETEPSHNHVGVDLHGDVTSSVAVTPLDTNDVYLQDETLKHAWVDYDGSSDALEVRVITSSIRPAEPVLTHTIDLANEIDPDVFVGFTAATGGLYSTHEICSFYFNNDLVDGGLHPNGGYTQGPTRVELSASPTSIDADGSTGSTITATAYDVSDQPVQGASITFETNAGTLSPSSGTTDANGEATTTLTATSAGEATVRATAEGGVYTTTVVSLDNLKPTIDQGDSLAVEVHEDGSLTDTSVLTATDNNPGDVVTWTLTSGPTHGSAEVGGVEEVGNDHQSSPSTLTYTPDDDSDDDDSFTVRVSDGRATDEVTVNVTVHDAPEVDTIKRGTAPGAETTNADTIEFDVAFSEAVSDVRTDDFSLYGSETATGTIDAVSGSGSSYTVTVNNVEDDGTLRLDLVDDDSITSQDTSTALGGEGTSGTADGGYTDGESYAIDNTPPTAKDDTTAQVDEGDGSVTLTGVNSWGANVTDNDTDAAATDPVTAVNGSAENVNSVVTGNEGGQFKVARDGSVTFDPDGGFQSLAKDEGRVTGVTVTIQDRVGLTDTAGLSVTVKGANDPPVASDDEAATNEDAPVTTGNVLDNDQDVDASDTLTVTDVATTTTTGAVTDNGDGTFDYDPDGQFEYLASGETATDTFTYTISDDQGGTDTGVVSITIEGLNDAPTGITLTHSTITENLTASTVVGTLSTADVDSNDTHTYTLENAGDTCEGLGPDNGSFAIDDNELKTDDSFDFEAQSAYTICVQTDDGAGGTYGEPFVIDVIDESVDLEIAKSVSDPTPAEDWTIRYTVTVTNAGPDRAKAILVTDTEPVSLTFQSSRATKGTYHVDTGLWDVGDLGETMSATLVITAAVDPAAELDLITNTAVISSFDQQDADDANNAAERPIVVRGSRFELVKTVDDLTPREGQPFTYAITLTNRGYTSTAVVSDTLPPQMAYVSDTPSQGNYHDETGVWYVGEVGKDQMATLDVTTRPRAGTGAPGLGSGTVVTNTASLVQSSRLDPEPADNTSRATVDIQHAEAVEARVTPSEGGELIVAATACTTTTVQVPDEVVTDSLTLIYTPLTTPTMPMPAGLQLANRLFDLTAYINGVAQRAYTFTTPISVTVHYGDTDVAGLNEDTLIVYAWDGDAWRDAACGEGYDRHPHENWLTVHVCHLTDFGLLGQSAAVGGVTRPLRVGSLLVKSGAYLMTVVVTVGLAAIVYGGGSRRKR